MVRPGMKRLRQAHSVKVQPNKTGTSFMQGQSVVLTKENIEKKGVVFNSGANTPYNDLSNNKTWKPNPADIAKDLYGASKKKESQINLLISELKPFVKNIGDATIIVPLIKEYLDLAVKNDDALIKLASIVQRGMSAAKSAGDPSGVLLSEEEKKQLLATVQDMELES